MNENKIYRETYARISKDEYIKLSLSYKDLDKIINEFRQDEDAYAKFLIHVDRCKKNEVPTESDVPRAELFGERLIAAIAKFAPKDVDPEIFSRVLDPHVEEEMLRREGVNVDWSGK